MQMEYSFLKDLVIKNAPNNQTRNLIVRSILIIEIYLSLKSFIINQLNSFSWVQF